MAADRSTVTLWGVEHRRLTVGLALTVTLVAFETMAVAAIMPEVKDDLGGLALYGWVFSGFFLASLLGIVASGQLADRRGLAMPYGTGLMLFALGLVIGGTAGSMPVLVAGRMLQGFGAGTTLTVSYAAIARGIPASLRPRMFAVLSTAWIVPGLIGPGAALAITHALSWRWVFMILVPFSLLAGLLTQPALAPMGAASPDVDGGHGARLRRAVVLVVALGAVFSATADVPVVVSVLLVALGLPVAGRAAAGLVPAGTARVRPGVPAAVATRGLLTFSFFAADAYLPLAVVDGRGAAAWIGGAALTVSAITWAGGAWFQSRAIDRIGPRRLDRLGFVALVVSVVVLIVVARGGPVGLVVLAWAIGGLGIGTAYAPQAVVVLGAARSGEEGEASAGIQLSDALGIALGTGVAGAIVSVGDARGWAVASSVTWVFVVALLVGLVGLWAAGRLPAEVPAPAPLP